MPLRYAIVAALVLFGLVTVFVAAQAFWQPHGSIGITTDYDAVIRSVARGSPAAHAGLRRGDRILLAKTPYEMRRYLAGVAANPPIGSRISFTVEQAGKQRDVQLLAARYDLTPAERSVLFFQCLASLIFIIVGASLILLRPSPATWGFGLYCLIILPTAPSPFLLPIKHGAIPLLFFYDVLQIVGVVGLIVFALEFPRRMRARWRTIVRRALPLIFVVLAAMIAYPDAANQLMGTGAGTENLLLQIALGLAWLLALCIAWDSYRRIEAGERERLNWVVIGLSIGIVASYIGQTLIYSPLLPSVPPAWLLNLLASLNVLLPLTIAHAVIRRRVLDIDFVVSNAILYTAFTVLLIATFGLVDWAFTHVLADFDLSLVVNAAISVLLAFAFEAIHDRAQKLVQTLLFRKRRDGLAHLEEIGRALRDARSSDAIEQAITKDAAAALGLTSAALFRRRDGTGFARTASTGWEAGDCSQIDDANALVAALRKGNQPIRLAKFDWVHGNLPNGTRSPLIAVPMTHRAELQGILFYGAHERGEDIDSEDLTALEGAIDCGAIGFDHLETERLRAINDIQSKAITSLQARVAELERRSPRVIRSAPR